MARIVCKGLYSYTKNAACLWGSIGQGPFLCIGEAGLVPPALCVDFYTVELTGGVGTTKVHDFAMLNIQGAIASIS